MVDVIAKATNDLYPTDILFQTPYWAQVKSQMGMAPMAFDILSSETWGDVLVLIKNHCGHKLALVPQGPEHAPGEDCYGQHLEDLSLRETSWLQASCTGLACALRGNAAASVMKWARFRPRLMTLTPSMVCTVSRLALVAESSCAAVRGTIP